MERVLIADDDLDDLRYTAHALKTHGYSVYLAHNGEEAISKAVQVRPGLLVLDIVMPRESGIEVANALKKMPYFREVPMVFLTSLKNERGIVQAPTNALLAKPLEIVQLLQVMQALLAKRTSKT